VVNRTHDYLRKDQVKSREMKFGQIKKKVTRHFTVRAAFFSDLRHSTLIKFFSLVFFFPNAHFFVVFVSLPALLTL